MPHLEWADLPITDDMVEREVKWAREQGNIFIAGVLETVWRDLRADVARLTAERAEHDDLLKQGNDRIYSDLFAKSELETRVALLTSQRDECAAIAMREAMGRNEMKLALARLMQGYRAVIQQGYDRVKALGGDCDTPEVMIAQDPWLRAATQALGQPNDESAPLDRGRSG